MSVAPQRVDPTELWSQVEDKTLPLVARVQAGATLIEWHQRVTDQLIADVREMVASRDLDVDTKAALYWQFDGLLKVKDDLGVAGPYDLEAMAERSPWTAPCNRCGEQVTVRSRTALKGLQNPKRPTWREWLCPACEQSRDDERREESGARWEERQRHIAELRSMPYRDYLKTDHWHETRQARLRAARYRCQVCNAGDCQLNVHHRTYERRGNEAARDLVVLCEDCHLLFHRNGQLVRS